MASPGSSGRCSRTPGFPAGPLGGGGRAVPAVGLGTASLRSVGEESFRGALLAALEVGYRHIDTASVYGSERVVGEAVAGAARRGVIACREEVFVTTKVWCTQCHPDLVLPSLRESLQNLQMEYVDMYLVHWPMSVKPTKPHYPMKREDIMPMDLRGVWQAMEECHQLGLAKMIGVSNFTTKKLQELLAFAKIPPAVNQVELNPVWQQKKLMEFCKAKGIHVTAYFPLGGRHSTSTVNPVLDSDVLKEIAAAKGKSVAQISLRWIYEQGASMVTTSTKRERLKENIDIFDWQLSDEDRLKISQIPQHKKVSVLSILCPDGGRAMAVVVPEAVLRHGDARPMPAVGMGVAEYPSTPERTRDAVLAALEAGFRHFDTASLYRTEAPLGEAIAEATRRGLLASREEAFVTTKLWCTQCHPDLVLPSLRESLRNLQMEYVDLYLIHLPISVKPGPMVFPVKKEDVVPFDFGGVWRAMEECLEECHRLGLAKAIGVSNFTTKHIDKLLAVATILPAVNQVEMNPTWQQRTVREYCDAKGIRVTAYSPLGGQNWGGSANYVMESSVSLRWIHEQGVTPIPKSYNKERLKQNLEIFDWELTKEDRLKISQIPQKKIVTAARMFSPDGEFASVDLSDMEIVEE
uniref:NADP-dependent oxidoreductase domain-containing protein n=1 Tax=Oryza rufipogon TaxID=4529 RepID=A0A0E0P9S9_ORYRU